MEILHPEPFGAIDERRWRADVAQVRRRAAAMTEDEFLVAVARLAVLGDRNGHGGVFPTDQPRLRMWPLRLHELADGWHVVDAADPTMVGSLLKAVGGRPIEQVTAALEPIVPFDNEQTRRARLGSYLVVPAFLRGLGIYGDGSLTLVGTEGKRRTVSARIQCWQQRFIELTGLTVPQIPLTLPAVGSPPADPYFWWRRQGDALVVGFERVLARSPGGVGIEAFVSELKTQVRQRRPAVLVVDARRNPGGENESGDPLMAFLREVAADERTSVRVLIGRGTYSAAALLLAELDTQVPVTFVGEASGGGSGTFGNPQTHRLRGAGVVVQIPGRWFSRLNDDIASIEPDRPAETTWSAFATGEDPVLDAALSP